MPDTVTFYEGRILAIGSQGQPGTPGFALQLRDTGEASVDGLWFTIHPATAREMLAIALTAAAGNLRVNARFDSVQGATTVCNLNLLLW